MRYEFTKDEWTDIRPLLPTKPRGVPRLDDRRILDGIFWVLRSGAPRRDLPGSFGPTPPATIASFVDEGQEAGTSLWLR
jgi:transposase